MTVSIVRMYFIVSLHYFGCASIRATTSSWWCPWEWGSDAIRKANPQTAFSLRAPCNSTGR